MGFAGDFVFRPVRGQYPKDNGDHFDFWVDFWYMEGYRTRILSNWIFLNSQHKLTVVMGKPALGTINNTHVILLLDSPLYHH